MVSKQNQELDALGRPPLYQKDGFTYLNVSNHMHDRKFDELPFIFHDPDNHKIYWVCNRTKEGNIVGSLNNQELSQSLECKYRDITEAITARDDLIKMGWLEGAMPNIVVKQPSMKRAERRRVQRKLYKASKKYEKLEESRKKRDVKIIQQKKEKEKNETLPSPSEQMNDTE